MAEQRWIILATKRCNLIGRDVELREQRLYPVADFLRTTGNEYRVRACGCSAAIQCNLAGIPCQWAFTSPDNNRL